MILVPVSGILMSMYSGDTIKFFGITLPMIVEKNPEIAAIMDMTHALLSKIFALLIAGHILFTIKHILVDKVNVLKRII